MKKKMGDERIDEHEDKCVCDNLLCTASNIAGHDSQVEHRDSTKALRAAT
jgi:hypothetical protein